MTQYQVYYAGLTVRIPARQNGELALAQLRLQGAAAVIEEGEAFADSEQEMNQRPSPVRL